MTKNKEKAANQQQKVSPAPSLWRYYISKLFSRSYILGNLPFLCFVCFLALIYIWNVHYTEKTVREIDEVSKQLKRIRWKYMTTQSELMNISKHSKMTNLVDDLGLQPLETPPKKIKLQDDY